MSYQVNQSGNRGCKAGCREESDTSAGHCETESSNGFDSQQFSEKRTVESWKEEARKCVSRQHHQWQAQAKRKR